MFAVILISLSFVPAVESSFFSDFFDGFFEPTITGMGGGGGSCAHTCRSSCPRSEVQIAGDCFPGQICCRDLNVCADGYLDTEEECEGGNLRGEDCASQGFINGTLSCGSSCELNTSLCSDCGDGTCNATETCASCPGDCNGETADCVGGEICDLGECVPVSCSDGTYADNCTSDLPVFCNGAGELVNNCTYCGCPAGYSCDSEEACKAPVVSDNGYEGRTVASNEVESVPSSGSASSSSYDGVKRKDTVEINIKGETYSFELKEISRGRNKKEAELVSDSITLVLVEGEPLYLDVDSFAGSDAKITVTDISSSSLNLNVEELEVVTFTKSSINLENNNMFDQEAIQQMSPILLGPEIEPIQANWYEFIVFNVFIFTMMIFFFYRVFTRLKK